MAFLKEPSAVSHTTDASGVTMPPLISYFIDFAHLIVMLQKKLHYKSTSNLMNTKHFIMIDETPL